jgi:hypothetical protein
MEEREFTLTCPGAVAGAEDVVGGGGSCRVCAGHERGRGEARAGEGRGQWCGGREGSGAVSE